MIRSVMVHNDGIIIALGIVEENVRLMKTGKPLGLEIGRMLKAGVYGPDDSDAVHADGEPPSEVTGEVTLLVYYGETHVEIVDRWNEELTQSGLHLPDRAMEDAAQLDEQLRAEGLI